MIKAPYSCTGCGNLFQGWARIGNHARYDKTCTPEKRFWGKVEKGAADACWPWLGAVTSKHGYGCVVWQRRTLGAHRVAWMLTNGAVPAGLCVLHRCDNRVCCNPAHHFLGTKQDNSDDKVAKGRQRSKSKLTEDEVRAIRSEYRAWAGNKRSNAKALAAKYGVRTGTIVLAANRKTWRHLA